jgi:hypothetical protein
VLTEQNSKYIIIMLNAFTFLKRQFNKQTQLVMYNLMNSKQTAAYGFPYVQNSVLLRGTYPRKCNLIYTHKSYSLSSDDFQERLQC